MTLKNKLVVVMLVLGVFYLILAVAALFALGVFISSGKLTALAVTVGLIAVLVLGVALTDRLYQSQGVR